MSSNNKHWNLQSKHDAYESSATQKQIEWFWFIHWIVHASFEKSLIRYLLSWLKIRFLNKTNEWSLFISNFCYAQLILFHAKWKSLFDSFHCTHTQNKNLDKHVERLKQQSEWESFCLEKLLYTECKARIKDKRGKYFFVKLYARFQTIIAYKNS